MDAIVLVGGEGTRLRPLTYDIPKQMLPIVDRTLVEHVVSWLGRHGIGRAVLSLGYRADAFIEAFPTGEIDGVKLAYAVDPEPLGTAGAIRFAAEQAGVDERFLVLNGDVLTDLDGAALVGFHDERGATASVYLTPVADPSAFGVVATDETAKVVEFIEKPAPGTAPTNLINAGVYVLEPSVLERIPQGRAVSIERETFPALVASGLLFAKSSDAYWLDTGTPAKYLEAQLDILAGLRANTRPAGAEVAAGQFVAAGGQILGKLAGVAYVGPDAHVEAEATLVDSVLGAGARMAQGARVERSALLPGACVSEGCVVTDSIVGPEAILRPGCKLSGMTVVRGGVEVGAGVELAGALYPTP